MFFPSPPLRAGISISKLVSNLQVRRMFMFPIYTLLTVDPLIPKEINQHQVLEVSKNFKVYYA